MAGDDGKVGRVLASCGQVWLGKAGTAWSGPAWRGAAWLGVVLHGRKSTKEVKSWQHRNTQRNTLGQTVIRQR